MEVQTDNGAMQEIGQGEAVVIPVMEVVQIMLLFLLGLTAVNRTLGVV